MATTGTYTFNLLAGDIVTKAFSDLGICTDGALDAQTANDALKTMNLMLKHWQQQGAHLWTENEAVIVLKPGQAAYTIADSTLTGQSLGVCQDSALITTQVATTPTPNASTNLYVTSTAGMSNGNNILLALNDGTQFATTIANVASSTHIVLSAATTGAAGIGAYVYSYPVGSSNAVQFFARQIYNIRLRDSNGIDRMLNELSRSDYESIANKTIQSQPMSVYVEDRLANNVITVYPVPSDMQHTLRFTYAGALDDVTVLTNNVPFQTEWGLTILLNLMVAIAPGYGKEAKIGKRDDPDSIAGRAYQSLTDALEWDREDVDVQFCPDTRKY